MTLIVEDGTGLTTANGYIAASYFTTHFTDRGIDVSAYNTAAVEAAIVRATDYVDKRFGPKFRGFRKTRLQALEWPRLDAFDNDDYLYYSEDAVPRPLEKAVAEYALLAAQLTNLLPTPARPFPVLDPVTGTVTSSASGALDFESKKVGPIEVKKSYVDMSQISNTYKPQGSSVTSSFNLPEYPVADEWIRELIRTGSTKLARA